MEQNGFTQHAQIVAVVAREVVEEPDAIERHPEIFDALSALARDDRLRGLFGGNGHDPVAFVNALVEGLAPYRTELLDDAPQLVESLVLLASELRRASREGLAASFVA